MLLKEASPATPMEEESAHPLLRGAENTTEGFEVHRANDKCTNMTYILHYQDDYDTHACLNHVSYAYFNVKHVNSILTIK